MKKQDELIERMVELAGIARKDGMMALEGQEVPDKFFAKGMQMLVDGADEAKLTSQLNQEIKAMKARHEVNHGAVGAWIDIAPAMGMIGTLVGLVAMLAALDDPSSIGPKMSVALITTLYGALIANAATAPIANKIGVNTEEELVYKDMVVAGMVELLNAPDPDGMVDMMLSRVPLGLLEEVTPQVREAEAG